LISGVSIEVIYVDGHQEKHDFSQEQVMVGSAPEVDLSLALDEFSPQHILVVSREAGCWVSVARGVQTQVLYNGIPVENQEVPWGAELDVGTVTLRLGEPLETVAAREKKQQSLVRLLGMVLLVFAVFYFLQDPQTHPPKAPTSAPEIFDKSVKLECKAKPERVGLRAAELQNAAEAYWHRYPFDPQEGIRAANMYLEAASCFTSVGELESAALMSKEHQGIVAHAENDYQTQRLQLSRALKNENYSLAETLLPDLARFVQHRPGPYLEWLGKVDIYLRNREE